MAAAYSVGSKGRTLADTEQNTDVTQAKINLLCRSDYQ